MATAWLIAARASAVSFVALIAHFDALRAKAKEKDFALEPMTKEESKDVYRLFLERTGRRSTIVTSNRARPNGS